MVAALVVSSERFFAAVARHSCHDYLSLLPSWCCTSCHYEVEEIVRAGSSGRDEESEESVRGYRGRAAISWLCVCVEGVVESSLIPSLLELMSSGGRKPFQLPTRLVFFFWFLFSIFGFSFLGLGGGKWYC